MYLFELIDAQIRHLNDSDLQTAMLYRRALCLTGLGLNIVFSAKPGVQQRALIREILQTVQYKEAIRILPYQNLAFHWRIFYGAARFGAVFQVWGMLCVMKKMINR